MAEKEIYELPIFKVALAYALRALLWENGDGDYDSEAPRRVYDKVMKQGKGSLVEHRNYRQMKDRVAFMWQEMRIHDPDMVMYHRMLNYYFGEDHE